MINNASIYFGVYLGVFLACSGYFILGIYTKKFLDDARTYFRGSTGLSLIIHELTFALVTIVTILFKLIAHISGQHFFWSDAVALTFLLLSTFLFHVYRPSDANCSLIIYLLWIYSGVSMILWHSFL